MAVLMTPPKMQFFDSNGDPLNAGKIYFYSAGTETPKDTYTTAAGSVANANPVVLDSAGRADIWLSTSGSYKIVVKTSADATISTTDNVTAYFAASSATFLDSQFTLQNGSDPTKQVVVSAAGVSTGTTVTYTLPNASGTLALLAATQAFTNKTLDNTNTITLKDTLFTLQDNSDTTKQAQFQLSGITTATTRTYTLPDASTTLVGHDATQTLSNKTLGSSNTISSVLSLPAGVLIQSVTATNATFMAITTAIAKDDSIPQNTEGDEVVTVSITPTSASNILEISFNGTGSANNAATNVTTALFVDSTADALTAVGVTTGTGDDLLTYSLLHRVTAGSTSARTYKIRIGPESGTAGVNGTSAARIYGGVALARITVREYKA